jgi:D-cysteine desulfhydrase family pyridoxal phosphate-dependent enzyme
LYNDYPRLSLGFFPTPLHELKKLSQLLNGPRIFIKRDDLTGLALGGNKVRKLEYIMADALVKQSQAIITVGAISSNHARQTAAAAAILGLECHLVLIGREPQERQGNYLLNNLLGAKCTCVRNSQAASTVEALMQQYSEEGKKPYFIPAGGHSTEGVIAYMHACQEIHQQAECNYAAVITAFGTGTTYAGLYLGEKTDNNIPQVIGISVGGDRDWCSEKVLSIIHPLEKQLGITLSQATDLNIYYDYIGAGYTKTYPQLREIIKLAACQEGILLDPVYSGKAMLGLIDLIKQGYFTREQNVLFLHTGGAPEIFSYNKFLTETD